MTSKCGKDKKVAHEPLANVPLHSYFIFTSSVNCYQLLLNRRTTNGILSFYSGASARAAKSRCYRNEKPITSFHKHVTHMSSQCGGLMCRNLWGNVGQDIFFVFAVMFK